MRGGGYIFVKNSQGISKQIQKTDTVVELMDAVAHAFGVTNPFDINFIFDGKKLDDQILAQIQSDATIYFTISRPPVRVGDRC
jgi:hypothetical protein